MVAIADAVLSPVDTVVSVMLGSWSWHRVDCLFAMCGYRHRVDCLFVGGMVGE